MTPSERYQHHLHSPGFLADAGQRAIVALLDDLQNRLAVRGRDESRLWSRLRRWWRGAAPPVQGLYLWGGVGRGKTFLMDLFFECLDEPRKVRMHFHRFMRRVHRDLTRLSGTPEPLDMVAMELAAEARVLCFDEFFVADIGDAMILAELLDGLFRRGVTLVATSNIPPSRLYENGLQRARFLPAIAAIERHTAVVNLDGPVDFRLRVLEQAEIYHFPLDHAAEDSLAGSFAALAPDPEAALDGVDLEVEGRDIRCRRLGDDVAWFDFGALCDGPRSAADYIEIARICHAVLISGVPVFGPAMEDQARRFISLVDEFYDRNVKLILSAAAPVADLYQGELLRFEFERTHSRLLEMQSRAYLARTHRP
ncbi:MAG: cell division protein ZapE [Gammaproteobacteria bacterium]|nr:cell division protein ZapE [Gammaproteobacteria bacterium]